MKSDPYKILGVPQSATQEEIKKAYRKLAIQHHPDKNGDNPDAADKFKEISSAHEIIGDKQRRAEYDARGSFNFGGHPGGMDINDIFGDVFGGFGDIFGRKTTHGAQPRDRKGRNINVDLQVSFETAAFGCNREVEVPKVAPCSTCSGTGAKPGSQIESCRKCGGSGHLMTQQGFMSITTTCPECLGSGRVVGNPCGDCRGSGQTEVRESFMLEVPPGVNTGTKIRVVGRGESGVGAGPPGDMIVRIIVRESDKFRREGYNVHSTITIPFTKASLGGKETVETLHGKEDIKIPPGLQPGTALRISNSGIPMLNHMGVGDHYVHVKVQIPSKMTQEQKDLLRKFEELCV